MEDFLRIEKILPVSTSGCCCCDLMRTELIKMLPLKQSCSSTVNRAIFSSFSKHFKLILQQPAISLSYRNINSANQCLELKDGHYYASRIDTVYINGPSSNVRLASSSLVLAPVALCFGIPIQQSAPRIDCVAVAVSQSRNQYRCETATTAVLG